jgi:predicted small metal-binding protein
MMKRCCCALIVLAFAAAITVRAQDSTKPAAKESGKMEMSKEEKAGALMSISCDPKCGFMMRSRDEKELMKGAKDHMKKHHPDMKMSDKDIKGMMKKEDESGMK